MSTHNNKLHIEVFTEPKNCSNCCLQSPPGNCFWVMTCMCGCGAAAPVCLHCIKEHMGTFSLTKRPKSCFHCKLVKCKGKKNERLIME